MPRPAKHDIREVAHMRGLSGPFFFAADSKSKPGKMICHFVRLETIEFDIEAFDETTFNVLHDDNDPRLKHLAACMNPS